MSSGLAHFSSEEIEHLSNSFQKMGREYKRSQGSNHNGYMHNAGSGWEDGSDDLKEEDVWGGHDTNTDWNCSYRESSDVESLTYDSGTEDEVVSKSSQSRKSWLSMELQAAGVTGHKKEYVGVGFAALEESNGGWAPGFSARKVKIPHVRGGAGGSGYANGWHDRDVSSKRGGVPQSAPVSMRMWPSKCGYGDNGDADVDDSSVEDGGDNDDQDDEDNDEDDYGERRGRLAPHEIVDRENERSRATTFSVIEGAGRTLKGLDLRKVRNAVWSRTGFED